MRVNGYIIALNRFELLSDTISDVSPYDCNGTFSFLHTNIRLLEMIILTYDEIPQSCNAGGGIHNSIAVPPQLVAISPIGRPPNAS